MSRPVIAAGRRRRLGRLLTLGPATTVVLTVLALPLTIMLLYSFWRFVPSKITDYTFTLGNYARLFTGLFYLKVALGTLELGLIVTAISLVLSYPLANWLGRTASPLKGMLTYLVFAPMMVGIVVRAYGWMVILGRNGLINNLLLHLGLIHVPLRLLYTRFAVVLGLVEVLMPFAVLPMISAVEKIDPRVEEAARALGASRFQTFWKVSLPLSRTGIISGGILVFSLSITAYALPALLGGARIQMISTLAYDAMLVSFNYPFGSAIGMFMVVIATAVVFYYMKLSGSGLGGTEE